MSSNWRMRIEEHTSDVNVNRTAVSRQLGIDVDLCATYRDRAHDCWTALLEPVTELNECR